MFWRRDKQTAIDFETQLQTIPYRNEGVEVAHPEDGSDALIVSVALRYRGLAKYLSPVLGARRSRKYRLMGVSRVVYESIDGHRTVESLIDELAANHKLTFLEARSLMAQYLKMLMARGLIVIVRPDGGGP